MAGRYMPTGWIAVHALLEDKQSEHITLFLAICDPGSSIVKSVFDCRLPDVSYQFLQEFADVMQKKQQLYMC